MLISQTMAILKVLAFLGTGLFLVLLGIVVVVARAKRRLRLAGFALLTVAVIASMYFSALLLFSLTSSELVLEAHQEKYFCEVDCHLAYSVVNAAETKALGEPPNQAIATGTYWVITVKSRFDETTISPHRGNGPLLPNSREASVVDDQGRSYNESAEGLRALEKRRALGTPLTQALRPGESYQTVLVFDLPSDVRRPRFLIHDTDWVSRVLIGDENSFLHKKTLFRLARSS